MCQPAPVCQRFIADVERRFDIPATYNKPGPGGVYLGSVGDQAHATRKSSHNCAPMQESPVGGVSYAPNYAHAVDYRPATETIGYEMVRRTLADPRTRYVLYANHGWYPDGTFEDISDNDRWSLSHPTFHVSFLPGTHDDTRPFFTDQPEEEFTVADIDRIVKAEEATRRAVINQAKITQQVIRNQHAKDREQRAKLAKDNAAALAASEEVEASQREIDRLTKGDD